MNETPEVKCLRCSEPLTFIGYRRLELDPIALSQGFFPAVTLDFYQCPKCGHVEMFQSDSGLDIRSRKLDPEKIDELKRSKEEYDYRGF